MNVNFVHSTGYVIAKDNISQRAYLNLKSKLSVLDFRSKEEVPKAIFEKDGYIFLPKIDIKMLEYMVGFKIQFQMIEAEEETVETWKLKYPPYKHQEKVIEDAYRHLKRDKDKRVVITLQAGYGKTYVLSNLISQLKVKFIFIVYSTKIAEQAMAEAARTIGSDGLYILTRGSDIMELDYDKIKGLYMTHAMLASIIKTYSIETISDILCDKIGISLKALDEFDREVGKIYKLESMMNFKYNIYLTATKYKSLKPDDRLYQLCFRKVKTLGGDVRLELNKDIISINYKFNPCSTENFKINRTDDTFKVYYNNYLARKDHLLDFIMTKMYKSNKEGKNPLFKKLLGEGGQIQFFVSRIENCNIVKEKLITRFGIRESSIGIINSSVKGNKIKAAEITKPWLITTSQSLGRGVDSPIVRAIVFLEFHFSLSEMTQIVNRVGRLNKEWGYFIMPSDKSFAKVSMSIEAKRKAGFFREHFKHQYELNMPEEYYDDDNYISGYRTGSPEAMEILKKRSKRVRRVSKDIKNAFLLKI